MLVGGGGEAVVAVAVAVVAVVVAVGGSGVLPMEGVCGAHGRFLIPSHQWKAEGKGIETKRLSLKYHSSMITV